ncbi:MAG TPA: histidine phosphatase family protein [Hyphomicrobiaceae bacterium]|nr:histidine phosphatase family protein [Hyphomicrobiaceae bacterium]
MASMTLTLLRHAKSSWDNPHIDDFDRPLAPRGRAAAPLMGEFMARQGIAPDLVICSEAQRARETLALVLAKIGAPREIRHQRQLYLAPPNRMTRIILTAWRGPEADRSRHIMLVGHNPGLHALAVELAEMGDAGLRADLAQKFPTTGLVVIEFGGDDPIHDLRGGRLRHFMTPRRLAGDPAP